MHGCWSGGPSDKNEVEAQGLGVAHYNFHCWRPAAAFHKDDDDGDNEVDEGHNALITIFP